MALTERAYDAAAAAEARERNGRPHLTDARRSANDTYKRRQARTAADTLLDIDPALWDEHTRRVLLTVLPRMAYRDELAEYGEPRARCGWLVDGWRCSLDEDHELAGIGGCIADHGRPNPILHDNGHYRA